MISNTKKTLQNLDVPDERIFIESFGDTKATTTTTVEGVTNAKLKAFLDDEEIDIIIPKGKTILRALIESGAEPPFSCEGGVCATCMCKLEKGKVHMMNNMALVDEEVEEGYILSCQSIPLTEDIEVVYE